MIHRTALLASLIFVVGVPAGAQSPAPTDQHATSPATPASPPAASPPAAGTDSAAAGSKAAGTDSAATGSKPASSAADTSSDPSPEILKEARREGFKPKKRDGVTQFCYTDATLGTRFETPKCVDEAHLRMVIEQREDQRNQLRQQGACTSCSGH